MSPLNVGCIFKISRESLFKVSIGGLLKEKNKQISAFEALSSCTYYNKACKQRPGYSLIWKVGKNCTY